MIFFYCYCFSAFSQTIYRPFFLSKENHIIYIPDDKGNIIPDFSYCGYMGGDDTIPNARIRVIVPVQNGDATSSIQNAINYVSHLPKDKYGIRGAILLQRGTYHVFGRLNIDSSGVILRGCGMGKNGTILLAEGKNRETLIRIMGIKDSIEEKPVQVTDNYVPVGAKKIHVNDIKKFKIGDNIAVHRPCTKEWINALGMNDFGGESGWLGWKPGDEEIVWDRKVYAIKGNEITLDAPITTALDTRYGGATISVYHWPGRISKVGIENLRLISNFDSTNTKDEEHCWMAITFENVENAWVRQVIFEHFAGSAVYILNTCKKITVQDCESLSPISEIGGERRYAFRTDGQETLFQRIYSEYGYHDFAVGFCAPGPNAFVQCESHLPYSYSGSIDSWASGVLFDNVKIDGGALCFKNLGHENHGAGWNAANSVFWQCSAALIACYSPPTAQNWAFGCWAEPDGNGHWYQSNEHIQPFSLYYAQLQDRLHKNVSYLSQLLEINTNENSSPSIEEANYLTSISNRPPLTLQEWIEQANVRDPIPIVATDIQSIYNIKSYQDLSKQIKLPTAPPVRIKNGWIVRGNKVVTGERYQVPWWSGDIQPKNLDHALPAITRFVPGRIGKGLTDDLNALSDEMLKRHVVAIEQNYGLWYDRRRDDHERVRRMDGNVWPPFYELPFERSGQGTAWDGLSKYDLTKYNVWYWARLKEFADLADKKGLILIHFNYFQHNLLEAGAHWVDFPWRTANNINNTGFPEPPPFAGDKRIFMADQFYDTSNLIRRKLHIAYIEKCLENFKENSGVIQLTGAEYTGPLPFIQFWLDVINRWELKNKKKELIGLSVTKDVQDAILYDTSRSKIVDIIDIRQWYYQADGDLYAPPGGRNLSPRQLGRIFHPKSTSFEQVYRAVYEYRKKFPEKAVIYSADGYDKFAWAVFMAGGSLASIPNIPDSNFLIEATNMSPLNSNINGEWILANKGNGYIIYLSLVKSVSIDLRNYPKKFIVYRINPKDGCILGKKEIIQGGRIVHIQKLIPGDQVIWIRKIS